MIHLIAVKIGPRNWVITTTDVRDRYAKEKNPAGAYMAERKRFEDKLDKNNNA